MTITKQRVEVPSFLCGWKEIANYLGKGVRTVQRYERDLGLPVRRPAGKAWGSVVATKVELDAWVLASPIREAYYLSRPLPDSTFSAANLAKRMDETRRLRDQMLVLKNEVMASVQLLSRSVQRLQSDLNQSHWNETGLSHLLDTKRPKPN